MATVSASTGAARAVLRVDAGMEVVLAAGCIALAVTSPVSGPWRLPGWAGAWLPIVLAVVLLVAAALLGGLSRGCDAPTLRAVGLANAGTAVVLLVWAVLDGGAGAVLRIVVAAVAVLVGVLAAVQVRSAGSA